MCPLSTICTGSSNETFYYSIHNLRHCAIIFLLPDWWFDVCARYKTQTRPPLLFYPQSADVFLRPREVGGRSYLMFQRYFLSYNMFLNYVSQACLTFCPVHYQSSFTSRLTQTGTLRQTLSLQLHAFFMSASPFMSLMVHPYLPCCPLSTRRHIKVTTHRKMSMGIFKKIFFPLY